ncbi:Imidazole glycerol phosphate synthase subunit HisF [Fundidesulfovibrio magnetotacticus]|uniref:imidazole glycerol-phosphate synthase n=1 Tax=Fundidesulfovibrio magnetotacticus TaxID=2730080 RepID=A0A6V8LV49_9BACT|nr:AglZ/HisF2 family acetamidino modification protein [Fundidesulfovibrio magnetotacticus]GFK94188.1 Imidazole glycerol phosphate synthase subunit HisF [Fundidesulfovibrio magnetotacticus]
MLLARVIPVLLLSGRGLVKGERFSGHRYLGDPINTVKIFDAKEVDELIILDIDATREHRLPPLELVQQVADQCLMPFGVGGGIRSVEDARRILEAGAEKVCLNTHALENPDLVSAIARDFGCQSVCVSLDVKKNWFGKPEVRTRCGSKAVSKDPVETARRMEQAGAGEIMVHCVDRDGTMQGYDIPLIQSVARAVEIPVIAAGGAGTVQDLRQAIAEGGASAAAAGAMFVFHGRRRAVLVSYPSKEELREIRGE